ncbi:MAG: TIGR04076 family protein [Bacteroidota bacterium]
MKFHPCKITVLKKDFYSDLINDYVKNPENMKICNLVEENQEFIATNPYSLPEGLCHSAWADIRPYIITMATGGEWDFMINPNSTLAICSDPFRPVVFKIERIK